MMAETALDDHVHAFTRIWQNELEAPGLLPYAADTIQTICDLMDNQSAILASTPKSADNSFRARLCQLEMSRLSYQLSSYHRHRLFKIIKNAYYYSQYQRSLMCAAETAFLESFRAAFEEELREVVLESFPEYDRLFPSKALLAGQAADNEPVVDVHPEDGKHVVVRIIEPVSQVQIDPNMPHELHDLLPNDIILLQYKAAKRLILDEVAECI